MDLNDLIEIGEKAIFARKPVQIRVCTAAGCLSSHAQGVKQKLDEAVAATGQADAVEVCEVGCMRLCCEGPLVHVEKSDGEAAIYERVTPEQAGSIVAGLKGGTVTARKGDLNRPFFTRQKTIVLENSGLVEPEKDRVVHRRGRLPVAVQGPARDDPRGRSSRRSPRAACAAAAARAIPPG